MGIFLKVNILGFPLGTFTGNKITRSGLLLTWTRLALSRSSFVGLSRPEDALYFQSLGMVRGNLYRT